MRIVGWAIRLFLLVVPMVVIASQVMRIFDIWTALQVVSSGIAVYLFIKLSRYHKGRLIVGWIGLAFWCIMTYILVLEPAFAAHYYDQKAPDWMNAAAPFVVALAPFFPLAAAAFDPLWDHWK